MALLDSAAGVVSGILNKGTVSAPDLAQLFQTIDNAGVYQKSIINALPAQLQQQYADYKATNAATGTALQTGVSNVGQNLLTQTNANFDPNAPAVKAAEDQAKTAIYADLPGQQNAIREALASSGGFDRGTASKQLAAPVIQAGAKYAQAVSGITTQQLQEKQRATQSAIDKIASMNDQTLQQLFGMNQQQALQILNGNRQDLKDQLTALVNQSTTQTNQTLGVEGANALNQYNNQVAQKAQSDALNNSLVNFGVSAATSIPGFVSGLGVPSDGSSAPAGYNPNVAPNQYASLGY